MSVIKNQYFSSFSLSLNDLDLENLKSIVNEKTNEAKMLFLNSSMVLDFEEVKEFDNLDIFLNNLSAYLLSKNIFLIGVFNIPQRYSETCFSLGIPILKNNKARKNSDLLNTYHYQSGSMRSGQTLYIPGNGIVYKGDVKTDAEISADGDIFIMGTLSGKAFAGFSGNRNARIIVTNFQPFMISIAGNVLHYEDHGSYFGKSVIVSLNDDNTLKIELIDK